MEDREVWWLNLDLLPPQPSRKSEQLKKELEKALKAADNLISMYLMCLFQLSLSSRNTPRYFAELSWFILHSFICGKFFFVAFY